jgi:type IV pilus assembly protein PilQ
MKILINKLNDSESTIVNKGLEKTMKSRIQKNIKLSQILIVLVSMMITTSLFAQANLESVDYNNKLNGSVEFTFVFDGNIDKPDVFMTAKPARLAIDMPNVVNNSGVKLLSIAKGNTKSLRVVSTSDKTRAVIDLFKSAHHELEVKGNELLVTVFGNSSITSKSSNNSKYNVENIDFRRGDKGQGRVIVTLNKPGIVINVRETAETIKLELNSTDLPENLDNKLDVIDFATPVSYVDVRQRNGNVTIEISANGNYEHYAYQTGLQYIIEINEIVDEAASGARALDQEVVYEGNKVSFNFQDIPVRAALKLIADASDLNIIIANSVEGSVTMRLIGVPWDQALDSVLNSKQLDKRQQGNVIWIAPATEIAEREQQKLLSLQEKEEFEPLKTIYIQVNYSKAGELAALLSGEGGEESAGGLLSDRGTVTYDERTNTLLVSDIPDRLVVVQGLVQALDVAIKQVQIESRIVVASDKFGDELGVRFGVNGSKEDSHGNILSTGGSLAGLDRLNSASINNRINSPSGSGLPNFTPGINGSPIIGPTLGERLNVNLPAAAGNASKWAFSILAADYLLDLELSALETEGRGEVISTPRVVTTNQTKASIKQGVQIPFEEASSSGATTIQFKDAVLSLEVTPLITPDDRVDLTLKINNDSIGENVPTSFGGSIPTIDTRSIETRVLVDNGQTIVLGGIYEQIKRSDKSKVPVLGDIPGLGALFRNKTVQNDKAELLIFVTPTIIKESL